MSFPYGDTVTLITRTKSGVDGDGNDVFTETSTDLANVPVWDPRFGNTELVQGQDTVFADLAMWLPYDVDVTAYDAVEVRGVRYEVDGSPARFRSPFTGKSGQQVNVNRITA